MRAFSTAAGAGGTGYVKTAITSDGNTRTYFARGYIDTWINFSRVLAKQNTAETVRIMWEDAAGTIQYGHATDGAIKLWNCSSNPILSGAFTIGVSHDISSISNAPTMYFNGVADTAVYDAGSGSNFVTNSDAYVWGNRESDGARPWHGALQGCAIWDAILGADEHLALAKGEDPRNIRPSKLLSYIDMDQRVFDWMGGAVTSTDNVYYDRAIPGRKHIFVPKFVSSASLRTLTLPAEAGSFSLSGQAASLVSGRLVSGAAGSFSLTGIDAAFDTTHVEEPAPAPETPQVGSVGRRVYFEVWKNVPIFEVEDEPQARKALKTIKRAVKRAVNRAKRGGPIPDLPKLEIRGSAPFIESLRAEIRDTQEDLERVYKALQDMDEDDIEALLID